jgi:hypothetical protein
VRKVRRTATHRWPAACRAPEELRVIDEQFAQLSDEADDTRLRSLVSETPLADREFGAHSATPTP